MKFELPDILLNPQNKKYHFNEAQINLLKNAKNEFIKDEQNYFLKSLWKVVLISLRRKVETYGNDLFINNLNRKDENIFFYTNDSLSKKIVQINDKSLLKNCLHQNIIEEKTYTTLIYIYWFYINDYKQSFTKLELFSLVNLLEDSLFKSKISKERLRKEKTKTNVHIFKQNYLPPKYTIPKRRKSDKLEFETKKRPIKKAELLLLQKKINSNFQYL